MIIIYSWKYHELLLKLFRSLILKKKVYELHIRTLMSSVHELFMFAHKQLMASWTSSLRDSFVIEN